MKAINGYKNSYIYKRAKTGYTYYIRENETIMQRPQKLKITDNIDTPADITCSGFFQKKVDQLADHATSNGVTLPEGIKEKLGNNFDTALQKATLFALIEVVSWGFWNAGKLEVFRSIECFGFPDEMTGENKAAIRFYRIDEDHPMIVELYELDGFTVYKTNKNGDEIEPNPYRKKKAYIKNTKEFPCKTLAREIVGESNHGVLPIFPLWANHLHTSVLTEGFQKDIDMYDRISSDFGSNLQRANDIYYVIKNYGGDSLDELVKEIERYRAIYTDGENAGAEIRTLEVPYQARQVALTLLKERIYEENQMLNTKELTGSSLTTTAIKVAMDGLEKAANRLEWQLDEFVSPILKLNGIDLDNVEIEFKRTGIINESEAIDNLLKAEEYIDNQTMLELLPNIPDKIVETIMERIEHQRKADADKRFPLTNNVEYDNGIEQQAG